jgi:hypothetical protein
MREKRRARERERERERERTLDKMTRKIVINDALQQYSQSPFFL